MELKNWQKLHLGAELKMCKEYLLLLNYGVCFLIGLVAINFLDTFINQPTPRFSGGTAILITTLTIGYLHYKIRKLIDNMLSVLDAYETYQKNRDEIENRNNFKT